MNQTAIKQFDWAVFKKKLTFVASIIVLIFSCLAASLRPSLLFAVFTLIFIALMIFRIVKYTKSKDLLFMAGICYVVNIFTLIFVWAFPSSPNIFFMQFGLSNGPVYSGVFLYRNTFAFHHVDKMTTAFIHILPPLFSYCIRWFPRHSSIWWWENFVDSEGHSKLTTFNPLGSWLFQYIIPNAIFIIHVLIYHLTVHVIVKPSEKYNDSYRYLCTKYRHFQKAKNVLPQSSHLLMWIFFNIISNALVSLVACLAWCSFLVHSLMMVLLVLVMTWNGASFYLDYFAQSALKRALLNKQVIPNPLGEQSIQISNSDLDMGEDESLQGSSEEI